MSLWVVGSGPLSTLPKKSPRLVIFANGSVAHIPKLRGSGFEKWLLIPSNLYPESASSLSCGTDLTLKSHHSILRQLIRAHSPYERLIVRQTLGFPAEKTIASLQARKLGLELHALTYDDMIRSILQVMSRAEFYSMVLGPERMSLESVIRLTSKKRMLSGSFSKPSTGVVALLLALEEICPEEELHVLGITANDISYPFATGMHPLRGLHINADLKILSAIQRKFPRNRLFIHDEDLRDATNRLDRSTFLTHLFNKSDQINRHKSG